MERSDSRKIESTKAPELQQIIAILHKWGIHTLSQLAALDKEELRARLGPEAFRLWERANGTSTRLLKFVQPPESFEESFEFDREIETAEPLLFMLCRFLEQLTLRLGAIYLVAKELTLRITFANPPWDGSAAADKQIYERVFKIPQPTNDVDLLFRMLHTHLDNFKSEYPIIAVSLEAEPVKPSQQQFCLFQTSLRDPHQLYETLARLVALVGSDRVGTPVLEETHRADAFHIEPFSWEVGAIDLNRFAPTAPLRAALRRFRPNIAASVLLARERPIHLRSLDVSGAVSGERGPYRASGNWWDEKWWERAEWDLQLENGILCRCHQSEENWEIDGVYD